MLRGIPTIIDLWDTPGFASVWPTDFPAYFDFEAEDRRAYALADVFIICFAISDTASFDIVRTKVRL